MINKLSALTIPLAVATVFGSVNVASAATFNFSFSNENGAVNGTVEGTIELPDGDGTFAATSIVVTSAPAALGYTLPFDVLANLTQVFANSFTVAGGSIDTVNSSFVAQNSSIGSVFTLNLPGLGSAFNVQGSGNGASGVQDSDSSTLSYTSAASVPEPSSLIALALVGGSLLLTKRVKS